MKSIQAQYISTDTGEIIIKNRFTICIDNFRSQSFNVNIERPTFETFAFSECEAIGKMMISDFEHKHKEILSIDKFIP